MWQVVGYSDQKLSTHCAVVCFSLHHYTKILSENGKEKRKDLRVSCKVLCFMQSEQGRKVTVHLTMSNDDVDSLIVDSIFIRSIGSLIGIDKNKKKVLQCFLKRFVPSIKVEVIPYQLKNIKESWMDQAKMLNQTWQSQWRFGKEMMICCTQCIFFICL
ncbi:uncharacterized protein LOC134252771 [Saccostrea cucullata]|uniref:uncharacterized protein LOC134252771 n=1 Tax=Saccostrea cuccullata TaxID=36930 RepID=UPI002ED596F3